MLLTVVTGAGPPSTPFRSVVMRAHPKRGVSALREIFERARATLRAGPGGDGLSAVE